MNKLGICILLLYFGIICYLIYLKKRQPSFLLVYAGIVITSIPCFFSIVMLGFDTSVHLGRIAALSQTLRDGYFPPRILTWVRNSYGWAAGIMYPQLFLFIPAFFGLIEPMVDKPIIYNYSNTFLIIVNILYVEFMYYSLMKIYKKELIAYIGSIFVCFFHHKLMSQYNIGQYGEMIAMMNISLYILGVYYLISKNYSKWYFLTIGSTFILGSHLITTFLVGILTVFTLIINFNIFTDKKCIIAMLKGYGFALLINLMLLVPLFDYMRTKDLITTPLQFDGVGNIDIKSATTFTGDTLGLLVTVLLIVTLILLVIFFKKYHTNLEYRTSLILFIISLIGFLFMTNPYIMNNLNKIEILKKVYANIQFARRWFGPISICAIMSSSYLIYLLINNIKYGKSLIIFVVVFLLSIPTLRSCIYDYMHQQYSSNIAPNMNWSDYSYRDTSMDYENIINNTINITSNVAITNWDKKGLKVTFNYILKDVNKTDGNEVQVPLLYYPGYISKDEKGNKLDIYRDKNNLLVIKLNGDNGTITTDFYGLPHWKYFDLISYLSIIAFILLIYYEKTGKILLVSKFIKSNNKTKK